MRTTQESTTEIILVGVLREEPLKIVMNARDSHGFEAWRRLWAVARAVESDETTIRTALVTDMALPELQTHLKYMRNNSTLNGVVPMEVTGATKVAKAKKKGRAQARARVARMIRAKVRLNQAGRFMMEIVAIAASMATWARDCWRKHTDKAKNVQKLGYVDPTQLRLIAPPSFPSAPSVARVASRTVAEQMIGGRHWNCGKRSAENVCGILPIEARTIVDSSVGSRSHPSVPWSSHSTVAVERRRDCSCPFLPSLTQVVH